MVVIARWPQISNSMISNTAFSYSMYNRRDDILLRCDWLGRVRLIITRSVRHLAIATLAMINGYTPSELFDWQVRYLDIYLFYVYGQDLQLCGVNVPVCLNVLRTFSCSSCDVAVLSGLTARCRRLQRTIVDFQ